MGIVVCFFFNLAICAVKMLTVNTAVAMTMTYLVVDVDKHGGEDKRAESLCLPLTEFSEQSLARLTLHSLHPMDRVGTRLPARRNCQDQL